VTVLCQSFRSAGRAFTLRLNQFRTKKRIQLCGGGREPLTQNIGRFKTTRQDLFSGCYFEPVSECPTTLELIVPLNRAAGATCEASTTSKPATSMVV
jgi:hypothetical protein